MHWRLVFPVFFLDIVVATLSQTVTTCCNQANSIVSSPIIENACSRTPQLNGYCYENYQISCDSQPSDYTTNLYYNTTATSPATCQMACLTGGGQTAGTVAFQEISPTFGNCWCFTGTKTTVAGSINDYILFINAHPACGSSSSTSSATQSSSNSLSTSSFSSTSTISSTSQSSSVSSSSTGTSTSSASATCTTSWLQEGPISYNGPVTFLTNASMANAMGNSFIASQLCQSACLSTNTCNYCRVYTDPNTGDFSCSLYDAVTPICNSDFGTFVSFT